MTSTVKPAFLRSMQLRDSAPRDGYPFDLPAVAAVDDVEFAPVTVFVGENGSGKSTIVEAIAITAGFNAEGGSQNLRFETFATHSEPADHLDLRCAVSSDSSTMGCRRAHSS